MRSMRVAAATQRLQARPARKLTPLPNSTRSLSNGGVGVASHVTTHASPGQTPFGFDFSPRGTLAVSEAFGGAVNASAASSYNISDHRFAVVSASVPTGQTAACWLVVTKNSKFAYTANAGGDSVSLYSLNRDGGLTLINGRAGEPGTGSHPTELALSHNSQYLYVRDAFTLNLSAFAVQADGSLSPMAGANGLAPSMAGLAAW
jgi:6-phosphogluconolactonase